MKNFLDALSNSGPAVRRYSEGRATGPREDRYRRRIDALNDEMKVARVRIFVGGFSPARSARSLRAEPAGKVLVRRALHRD